MRLTSAWYQPSLVVWTAFIASELVRGGGQPRRVGINIDQGALDRDLRRRLAERGAFPEFIAVEFKRVMQVVFQGTTATMPSKPADRPLTWSADADDLRLQMEAKRRQEADDA